MRKAAQAYWLPSSNTTFDEAMILFTGRSVHITKMPNKPIGLGYKVFCLADHGYIYDFHMSSNVKGLDSVSEEAKTIADLTPTGQMVFTLMRQLQRRHRNRAWNVFMDNFFTTIPLLSALRKIGVGGCGTARENQTGFPKEFKFDKKKRKLDYHFKSGIVRD